VLASRTLTGGVSEAPFEYEYEYHFIEYEYDEE
jgi:parvulin-like peptidyl-prolyl isomerase